MLTVENDGLIIQKSMCTLISDEELKRQMSVLVKLIR